MISTDAHVDVGSAWWPNHWSTAIPTEIGYWQVKHGLDCQEPALVVGDGCHPAELGVPRRLRDPAAEPLDLGDRLVDVGHLEVGAPVRGQRLGHLRPDSPDPAGRLAPGPKAGVGEPVGGHVVELPADHAGVEGLRLLEGPGELLVPGNRPRLVSVLARRTPSGGSVPLRNPAPARAPCAGSAPPRRWDVPGRG